MKKIDILGHGNVPLSIILDIIFFLFGNNSAIRIIKNIEVNDNTPFKIDELPYTVISSCKWRPASLNMIIMGVMKTGNKRTVYDYFFREHNIDFKRYSNLIHPNTSIAKTTILGNGIHCSAGVVTGPYSEICDLVTINRNVSIGHHTKISNFCSLNPGSNIAGFCDIGEGATIGMGANIIDGITIGNNTVIGAGSLVTKDIPENVIAYGIPVKVVRENKDS